MEATKALLRFNLRARVESALEAESQLLVQHWSSAECQANFKRFLDDEDIGLQRQRVDAWSTSFAELDRAASCFVVLERSWWRARFAELRRVHAWLSRSCSIALAGRPATTIFGCSTALCRAVSCSIARVCEATATTCGCSVALCRARSIRAMPCRCSRGAGGTFWFYEVCLWTLIVVENV